MKEKLFAAVLLIAVLPVQTWAETTLEHDPNSLIPENPMMSRDGVAPAVPGHRFGHGTELGARAAPQDKQSAQQNIYATFTSAPFLSRDNLVRTIDEFQVVVRLDEDLEEIIDEEEFEQAIGRQLESAGFTITEDAPADIVFSFLQLQRTFGGAFRDAVAMWALQAEIRIDSFTFFDGDFYLMPFYLYENFSVQMTPSSIAVNRLSASNVRAELLDMADELIDGLPRGEIDEAPAPFPEGGPVFGELTEDAVLDLYSAFVERLQAAAVSSNYRAVTISRPLTTVFSLRRPIIILVGDAATYVSADALIDALVEHLRDVGVNISPSAPFAIFIQQGLLLHRQASPFDSPGYAGVMTDMNVTGVGLVFQMPDGQWYRANPFIDIDQLNYLDTNQAINWDARNRFLQYANESYEDIADLFLR
ncbi:MAG: hypothetical protein H6843_05410 [Rhodospirillaceae bacterium]|nr:hypothetical protein [Rhodospirillaceae bacterium]